MSNEPSTESRLLDYTDLVGGFLMLSPKGQLFSLSQFLVSADFAKLVPRISSNSFRSLNPLIAKLTPSKILLVLHPGERASGYFLMDIMAGAKKRSMKVFQGPAEIVANGLESNLFPVIHLGELQKAAAVSRRNRSPLSIRVRYLVLRPNLPDSWRNAVKEIFLANAESDGDKTRVLERKIKELQVAIDRAAVEGFLAKCIWMDSETGLLGRLQGSVEGETFKVQVTGDAEIDSFGRSLAKLPDGSFHVRGEIANVLPAPVREHPWSCPTLHIYNDAFREKHDLDEFYSLYKGLKALCEVGAPVLTLRDAGLGDAIPVNLLRPSAAGDYLTQMMAREFPTREIVWDSLPGS